MMTGFAAITAAFCILFVAVKTTPKQNAGEWGFVEKCLIRTSALIPLACGLTFYYFIISLETRIKRSNYELFFILLITLLCISYAFFLARLNYAVVLLTLFLAFLLTFFFIVIFLGSRHPLLLPFIAFGGAYLWFVGKTAFGS